MIQDDNAIELFCTCFATRTFTCEVFAKNSSFKLKALPFFKGKVFRLNFDTRRNHIFKFPWIRDFDFPVFGAPLLIL